MNSEQNVRFKMQDLFQWLNSYSLHPQREMGENVISVRDVQMMEGIVKIFSDFTSSQEIHGICRTFYDAYLSGDNKLKLFVSLLLPTMLSAYLVHLHADDSVGSTNTKHPLFNQFNHNPHSSFTLDNLSAFINPLESIAFLLSELCQYAPAFIRSPEHYSSDIASLPDYRVASVFHSPPSRLFAKYQQSETACATFTKTSKPKFNRTTSITTIPPPTLPDFDPTCIVRIYVDALERQFQEGTGEQLGIVVISIHTFCDFVDRLTALNLRRILPYSHRYHLGLLTDLSIAIDKLLFMLSFDISQPTKSSITPFSDDKETLRGRLFEDLLPKMERYASYHCFASVMLIVGAMRNAWRLSLYSVASAITAAMTPTCRRVSLTSDEETDLSDSTSNDLIDCMRTFKPAHRLSVFTNANFRAEPVSEDIPTDGRQEMARMPIATQLHLHQNRTYRRHQQSQQNLKAVLTKSYDNLCSALSSTVSSDKGSQHPWRFWSKDRREKS